MQHIRNTLPDIKARITQQLQKYNAELASLGGPLGDGSGGNVVLSVITEFTNEFRTVIDGNTNDLSLNELSGGARISFVFHELFNNGVKSIDPFDQVKDGDIRTILYNSSVSGRRGHFDCLAFNKYLGFNAIVVCWYPSLRGHCQAANQTTRGTWLEMLSTGIR